jgi:hypothetical protein
MKNQIKQQVPQGDNLGAALAVRFRPAKNVLVVPDDHYRTVPSLIEMNVEHVEIKMPDGTDTWKRVEPGEVVYPESKQLAEEHVECVGVFLSIMQHGGIVTPRGPLVTEVVLGELGAVPLTALIEQHKAQIRGG